MSLQRGEVGRRALPQRLPALGPGKAKWRRHHEHSRQIVFRRSRGRCEVFGCPAPARDWSHLFGRGHLLAEPWCSLPELTLGLCRTHHNAIDRGLDPELRLSLRWTALERLATRFLLPLPDQRQEVLGEARWLVQAVECSWRWDELGQRVVQRCE